jgi:hypothetical protein
VEVNSSTRIPVSVILERRLTRSGRWTAPRWELAGVLPGESGGNSERVLLADSDGVQRYLWSGLCLELFKDGAEGYWYNLMSDAPYLFLVCSIDESGSGDEIEPMLVTANQDEALGHMESDDLVLSISMPAELCDRLERFVVENYVPATKQKRKRRDWVKGSSYVKRGSSEQPGAATSPGERNDGHH